MVLTGPSGSSRLDNRLTLNGAYFHTNYDDVDLTVRLGIAPTVFNGGKAGILGFELEGTFVAKVLGRCAAALPPPLGRPRPVPCSRKPLSAGRKTTGHEKPGR